MYNLYKRVGFLPLICVCQFDSQAQLEKHEEGKKVKIFFPSSMLITFTVSWVCVTPLG